MSVERLSLPISAGKNGISIIKQYSVKETHPIHCHDFGELFFVSQGQGMHCINDRHHLLEKGSLVYIRPDDIHRFSAVNYFDFVMYSLGFPEEETFRACEYLNLQLPNTILPPHTVLHGDFFYHVEQQMDQLLQTPPALRAPIFRALFPSILHQLQIPDDTALKDYSIPAWLAELEHMMRKRENYIAGLPRMLELCQYSQEYLNRMFRLHLKTTPTEYINSRRMVYAAELLTEGKYNVTEICFMTGFNNLSHFYEVFRKQYGCSPKKFISIKLSQQTSSLESNT